LNCSFISNSGNYQQAYGQALNSSTSGGSTSHMMSYQTWNGGANTLVVGNTFGPIAFGTGGGTMTEKARLHTSGGVSIGNTTDPGAGSLGVNGNIYMASAQNGIQGGGVYTYTADVSSPTFNVFYNAFQLPTPVNNRPHAYLVTAILANNTTTYNACSIVYQGHSGGVYYATIINLSSNDVSLGLSATNVANPYVQVRDNSSGGAQVLRVSAVLITPF
jgi:hypothetical protein